MDVARVAGSPRDPIKMDRLLRALARHVSTEVAVSTLAADAGGADGALSWGTVADYLDVLERLMILEEQPAWAPHMRSKTVVRTSSKRHFVDPSLAVAALGGSPERLLSDLNLMGLDVRIDGGPRVAGPCPTARWPGPALPRQECSRSMRSCNSTTADGRRSK